MNKRRKRGSIMWFPGSALAACMFLTSCRSSEPGESPTPEESGSVDSPAATKKIDLSSFTRIDSMEGTYVVWYRTDPSPIPLNEMFDIEVAIQSPTGERPSETVALDVDARMPEHRHGMNVEPEIRLLGAGHFLAEGMQFHMPGRWELYFDMTRAGVIERAMDVIELE